MRSVVAVLVTCLVTTGCAGPHSSGALWAQQNLEQEAALFRLGDAQRLQQAQAFELGLADDSLRAERTRIMHELESCPGPQQTLAVSPGDKVRDGIRIRAQGDAPRLGQVAQLALADWQVRRAHATGRSDLCDAAMATLRGASAQTPTPQPSALPRNPADGTVTRDPRQTTAPMETQPAAVVVSNYGLGYSKVVHAPSPLPEYLALVYGGWLFASDGVASVDQETAAAQVDRVASAYPEWEPDGLYAALGAGTG